MFNLSTTSMAYTCSGSLYKALLMSFWRKSANTNSNAMFKSHRFWFWLQLVQFLPHRLPHMIIQIVHNLNFKINYLRHDFVSVTLYICLRCYMFFDPQNQWDGLTKSDLTFVLFKFSVKFGNCI